ncbi:hypothetical protein [Qipengyuania sp. ASV99]|uniref:hypothetical protein n=1 Tax=Qipengyuania sp. ASV99 TaxID=3399681 RepID=UPI003A4C7312
MKERFKKLYRFYDPLVDFTVYMMIPLVLYAKGLRLFMTRDELIALPTSPAHDMIFFGVWILMVFLFAAKFMRDEFAQKIWNRAASTFAYFVVFLPYVLVVLSGLFVKDIYLWFEAGGVAFVDSLDTPPPFPTAKDPADVRQFVMFYGVFETLIEIFTWSPVLFFAIYKFHRWRDT